MTRLSMYRFMASRKARWVRFSISPGTAFDQAQLLVELLRAAGHTANYRLGDITVSAAEFEGWFGVDNATVACHLLADGGIPASFGGSSPAGCTGLGTNLPGNITLSHIWVEGTKSGGGSFTYDPSFKDHQLLPRAFNPKSEMNYSTGAMLTTAGGTVGSSTGHSFNTSAINSSLDSLSSTLIGKLNNPSNYDQSMDQLLGAELIKPLDERTGYSGASGNYSNISSTSEIPNAYRTLVTLEFFVRDDANFSDDLAETYTFYGDVLHGRRLAFDWEGYEDGSTRPRAQLTLDDLRVGLVSTHGYSANNLQIHEHSLDIANGNATTVKFSLDHSYASNGGSYMDREYLRGFGSFSQPVTFVFGFGGGSDALQRKLGEEHYRDFYYDVTSTCISGSQIDQNTQGVVSEIKLTEHIKTQVGYGWLAQFSRAVDLQARTVGAVAQHHHSFGLASTTAGWRNACEAVTQNASGFWYQADEFQDFSEFFGTPQVHPNRNIAQMFASAIQLDMVSGISVNQRDGSENDRRATAQAIAFAGSSLEGSVFEQYMEKVATASVAERFEWFNANGGPNQTFHIVAPNDPRLNATGAVVASSGEVLSGYAWFKRYADQGYIIVAPEGNQLGPGAVGVVPGSVSEIGQSVERGAAFMAFQPDSGDIAHIVFTGYNTAKGGGASTQGDGEFDPSGVADILRDQFEDRSNQHGVALANGQLSYSPAADITTGSGQFPYALSFQRSYNTSVVARVAWALAGPTTGI